MRVCTITTLSLALFLVALGSKEAKANDGITLNAGGTSTLGWAFTETPGWRSSTNPVTHQGDDALALDWNKGSENEDEGESILSVASGTVIFIQTGLGRIPPGGQITFGNQVIVQLDDDPSFAVKYAHLNNVSVNLGQHVNLGDPIGSLGSSGLTGQLPFTAHLHLVLYKNIDQFPNPSEGCFAGRETRTAVEWLAEGRVPCQVNGVTTKFAAPFSLDPNIRGVPEWTPINTGLTDLNVRSIAIDPGNPNTLYIGTTGGLFKSLNGGNSWSSSSTGLIDLGIQDIAIDPAIPSTLYAGTSAGGVHKSIDAGNTWVTINTGLPTLNVPSVAIHLQNSSILYCGPDAFGIYRSTDAGNTWSNVGGGRDVRHFALDPANPAIAYASTVQSVLKTTNNGTSWFSAGSRLPSPFINGLAVDPSNTSIVYAGPHPDGVWKTFSGGTVFPFGTRALQVPCCWFQFPSNNGLPAGFTVLALAVDPANSNIVYAGTDGAGVFKSADAGNSWVAFNDGLTTLSIGRSALAIDPTNPDVVYVGTGGGGVFKLAPADAIPPETSITSAVDGNGTTVANGASTLSNSLTVTFTGTDNVGVASFECSLDGAMFSSCTTPQSLTGLVVGLHTIQVRAIDAAGNIDPTPASFTWTILTPTQATQNLIDDVNDLVTSGVLNQGQGTSLAAKLDAAIKKISQGNTTPAINQLQAFINQVNAFINSGVLSTTEGQPLIDETNDIINKLNGLGKKVISRDTELTVLPESYGLEQNYPNPFNPETEIRFQLPKTSRVVVRIFNTLGQEIRTLADTQYKAGYHIIRWDAKDNNGNAVSSGIYFYKMQAGNFIQVKKMSLLR